MEDNLIHLSQLKDAKVKECLRERYIAQKFYTWAGPTLVAINPMQDVLEPYSEDVMEHFSQGIQTSATPHVFAIGEKSLSHLKWNLEKSHQAIVVNGESGAGKTCSTRHLLSYFAFRERMSAVNKNRSSQNFKDIEQLVCISNPLLESLGNAATIRNHNSSRFGKLIRLFYSGEGEQTRLEKATIETYLLESTRVAKQAAKERNFHIFYQMLAGLPDSTLSELKLNNSTWKIASSSWNQNDKEQFAETLRAMEMLGLKDFQSSLWKLLAALLHLGNVEFTGDEEIIIRHECEKHLAAAADLLDLEKEELLSVLTVKSFNAGKNVVQRVCSGAAECAARRDTFLKLLYRLSFDFVLQRVNMQLRGTEQVQFKKYKNLCILDLYGFESFDHGNSLEQLCINYANERLQYFFTINYLNEQIVNLTDEGLQVTGVDLQLKEKQSLISTLDGPMSVFGVLNEECSLNRGFTDEQICQRIHGTLNKGSVNHLMNNPALKSPRLPRLKTPFVDFTIQHYAGPVTYSTTSMLDKNRDQVPAEFVNLLLKSQNNFICQLITEEAGTLSRNIKSGRKHTVLAKFKNSLDNLILTLKSCNVHYVRCIRPNNWSESNQWDQDYVEMQLNACGVLDTIKLSSFGFPLRMKMADFASRYSVLLPKPNQNEGSSAKDSCRLIIEEFKILSNEIQLGREVVYLSDYGFELVEKFKYFFLESSAKKIQTFWKSIRRHKAAVKLQTWWKKKISVLRLKRRLKELVLSIQIVKRSLRRWVYERKKKILIEEDPANDVEDIGLSSGDVVMDIDNVSSSNEERYEIVEEKRAKIRAVAVVPPITRNPATFPITDPCSMSTKSKLDLNPEISAFLSLPLPRRIVFYRDGVVTIRHIPQVRLRLSLHKKVLKYSSTLPKSLLPLGLTDAL